jgi:hypothetical protein
MRHNRTDDFQWALAPHSQFPARWIRWSSITMVQKWPQVIRKEYGFRK